jgi:tRNA modification GTPase
MADKTIFALSTPKGRGGIAVVRVSGKHALNSFGKLCSKDSPKPRISNYEKLINPVSRETIDHAIVTYYRSPNSFTGEDTVEYAVHGGLAIINELLACLTECTNHRMAEPGEFTRRAFENGKLDLTEAEAVADLIDAETIMQKNQALGQLSGQLSQIYNDWTERLKTLLAHTEADLEFPDEDVPDMLADTAKPIAETILHEISQHLDDAHRGERIRDGIEIAVIGAPNAGKSSLVNALARRDIAIVSDVAGTTRDMLEVHLDIGGYPVRLVDTAGLRPMHMQAEGHDKIENEGIARALHRAENADFRMVVFDGSLDEPDLHTKSLLTKPGSFRRRPESSKTSSFKDPGLHRDDESGRDIVVINKTDQAINFELDNAIYISAMKNEGIDKLIDRIRIVCTDNFPPSESASLTRLRHRDALQDSAECLQRALESDEQELFCEDIRLALRGLGRITGRVVADDILDIVFSTFCLGK